MHLYSVTLQRATGISHAIFGNFSAPKAQEIIISRGKILELLRPDDLGKVHTVLSQEVFGHVRSIVPFRLTGANRDYIVVGSDSGRIVILEYDVIRNQFIKVHQETYGKTGSRRIVPGQYLAVDPKGRAVMIGAVEKQKFVYILNRDSAARLTISSPLEAHKSHTLVFSTCGVDVGFDNPIFACLELDYGDVDEDPTGAAAAEATKVLTFYEMDLGLNHVIRKWTDPVANGANMLVTVPGGNDGPGGVLVCCENFVIYKNQDKPEVFCPLPRRADMQPDRGLLVVAAIAHKQKGLSFILLQTEYGDIYKATLRHEEGVVVELRLQYFDTIPVASSLCVLRTGFLFAASEFGNHGFYQFSGIGDDENEVVATSLNTDSIASFHPRDLKNLVLIDEIESTSPLTDMKVLDLANEGTPQVYALCGRGARSSLRVLRHGLAVAEMAQSPLPGRPNAVWTVKGSNADAYDRYIVVSFVNATLVLSIGQTVDEVKDSGFLSNTPTLLTALLADDALLQVHPNGIRHIRADRRINEWKTPGRKSITKATANPRQVVIALAGGEVIYFELDVTGQLMEVAKKEMGVDVACIDVGPLPAGRQRSRFLCVGGYDNTVRMLGLDPDNVMQVLSMQAVSATPESACLVNMAAQASVVGAAGGNIGTGLEDSQLFLNVGLINGVLLRTAVDVATGTLSDTRTRFLGSRPVKLFKVEVNKASAVLALSSRPWMCYNYMNRFFMTPISYETLEYATNFCSERCEEGVVAIVGSTLRILTTERLGDVFNQSSMQLRYTPRRMVVHPMSGYLVVIEADHNTVSERARKELSKQADEMEVDKANGVEPLSEAQVGRHKAGPGCWGSCIRLVDAVQLETLDLYELEDNEAAFSAIIMDFEGHPGELFLIVGTAAELQLHPRKCVAGFLHVYRFVDNGRRLELLHKTQTDDVPLSLASYHGRLLAGIGNSLRLFDLGKKKLLKKCEEKGLHVAINAIHVEKDRIILSDVAESLQVLKYRRSENQFYVIADDTVPRWVTASCVLDYDTVAAADKFENVFVARLPADLNESEADDPTGSRFKYEGGALNGAAFKMEEIIQYHVGEVVTCMSRTSLVPGGAEVILYGTVMGTIGALLPFSSREDVDFFSHLEMYLRQEAPPLCGRDHMMYRSSYYPVQNVVDGDLCESFSSLEMSKQMALATDLDRKPGEIVKKVEEARHRIL